jgi:hypothetical protein
MHFTSGGGTAAHTHTHTHTPKRRSIGRVGKRALGQRNAV